MTQPPKDTTDVVEAAPALQTIDPTALAQVNGGARRAAASGGGGDADTSVMTALTGILESINDLARSRSAGGGLTTQDVALIMMVLQQRNQPQPVVVAQPATIRPHADGTLW